MCNLSDYIFEKGIEKGIEKSIEKGIEKMVILYSWLKENNRLEEAEAVMKKENEELRTILFAEFNKAKEATV